MQKQDVVNEVLNIFNLIDFEYYGVKNETETQNGSIIKFSVPETSDTFNGSPEELMKCFKQNCLKMLKNLLMKMVESDGAINDFDDDEFFDEFIEEYLSIKFYGKIRTGEHWTTEMGDKAVEEYNKKLAEARQGMMEALSYQEI